jgi:hypothetical protein
MLLSRTKEVLDSELDKWGDKVLENIEEVSRELGRGDQKVVEELIKVYQ